MNHPSFVVDASKQGQATGTPVILFGAGDTNPGEDFTVSQQASVHDWFEAGLVPAVLDAAFGGDVGFELRRRSRAPSSR